MKTLVVGASGATGKLLVEQLLTSGHRVKILVRPTSIFPEHWSDSKSLSIVKKNFTDISLPEMSEIIADCQSVASCLGHNLTWKGLYGKPRMLVANTVELLCQAILTNALEKPTKFVLMNTAGNSNKGVPEVVSPEQRLVTGLIRLLLPPHLDNERAAEYLRREVGSENRYIEWVVVRPDTLIDDEEVTDYTLHSSPTRSAIFNPGKTSRINAGHLMAELIQDDNLWRNWKGQMPVIYNVRNN